MWALSVVAMGLGELHYVSSRPSSECSKRYCSLSCNPALSCLEIQRVRVFGTAFFMKDYLTRLPMHNDGLEVQAKVCGKCRQLVLTYRHSMKCIVCGGILKPVNKSDQAGPLSEPYAVYSSSSRSCNSLKRFLFCSSSSSVLGP